MRMHECRDPANIPNLIKPAFLFLASILPIFVAGCHGDTDRAEEPPEAFQISTLSSSPDLVTGGDALVEVVVPKTVPLNAVRISLNGEDISEQLAVSDADLRILRGLITGLETGQESSSGGSNSLIVSNAEQPEQKNEIILVNHPITGPVLSGPHLSPYECRTVENGLEEPLDSNCSAQTQVVWFYRNDQGSFKPLTDPTGPLPSDLVTTTTNDGNTVPYVVRVESGTINRGVYRLAVLDDPSSSASNPTWTPGAGWNRKLVVQFNGGGGARFNQGVLPIESILSHRELSRGFALANSTELFNAQHANPHLQGETLMMLKEHIIEEFGDVPVWTAGFGASGGALQQYMIAQLYPGLLDGIQADTSFPETLMPDVFDCRLLNNVYLSDLATWTEDKRVAVNGFNINTCIAWDLAFGSVIKSDNAAGCTFTDPSNIANVFDRAANPDGIRCDIFQTNVNLLGVRPGTQEARRALDNVGVQYGLGALNNGTISVEEFLDLNEQVGGYDGDGNVHSQRTIADPGALEITYSGGWKNSFSGPGLANIPIITMRGNADSVGNIHDTMQDLIIRARLQRENGRSDNQIIWSLGSMSGVDHWSAALDLMNSWLDNIAADPAPPSIDKVVRNKPADANDACWDETGQRIDEPASLDPEAECNVVYPRFSTPRLVAGSPLVNDVLKCQLKPIDMTDYTVTFTSAQETRLMNIFPEGVCDWSKPSVGQEPLRGTFLELPLD